MKEYSTEEITFLDEPNNEYSNEEVTFLDAPPKEKPPIDIGIIRNFANSYAKSNVSYSSALVGQYDPGFSDVMDEQAEQDYPTEPGVVNFVGQALGSIAPTAALLAVKAPALVAGLFYSMVGFGSGRKAVNDYKERTGEEVPIEDELFIAAGYAASELVPEKLGFGYLTDVIRKQPPQFLKKIGEKILGDEPGTAAKMMMTSLEGAAIEMPDEMSTQILQQGIESTLLDPQTPLFDMEATLMAGASGAIGGAALAPLKPLLQNERVRAFTENPSRRNMQRAFGFSEKTKEGRDKIAGWLSKVTEQEETPEPLEPLRERDNSQGVLDNRNETQEEIISEPETQPEQVLENEAVTEPEMEPTTQLQPELGETIESPGGIVAVPELQQPMRRATPETNEERVRRQMTKQLLPDGREIESRYEVRDIEELIEGEDIGIETDVPFTDLQQNVLGGTQQLKDVRERYERGEGEQYIQELMDNADQYGLTPDDIRRHDKPILIKTNYSQVDPRKKIYPSGLETKEQAASDANLVEEIIDKFNPTESGGISAKGNQPFLEAFRQRVQGDVDDKTLIARVENALFSKVYRDDDLIADNVDGTDVAVKNFLKAMAKAAPTFLKSKQKVDKTDPLVDNVVTAYHLIKSAKKQKKTVKDLLKDKSLKKLVPYKAQAVAEYFEANNTKPAQMGFYLRNLANIIGSTEAMLRQIQQPDLAAIKSDLGRVEETHAKRQFKKKPSGKQPGRPTGRKRSDVQKSDDTSTPPDESGTRGEGRGTPETSIMDDPVIAQEIEDYYSKIEDFTERFKGKPFQIKNAEHHSLITVTKSAKQQGKWQVTFFDKQGNPLSDMVRDTFDGAVLALVESASVDDLSEAEEKVLKGARKTPAGEGKKKKPEPAKKKDDSDRSPMVAAYDEAKSKNTDKIVFLRAGDFYHTFRGDAEKVAEIFSEKLEQKKDGDDTVPMALALYHNIENYVNILKAQGIESVLMDAPKRKKKGVRKSGGNSGKSKSFEIQPGAKPGPTRTQTKASESPPPEAQSPPAPSGAGTNFNDVPQPERFTEGSKPLFELIDLVRLARSLGALPKIFQKIDRKYSRAGQFRARGEDAEIRLSAFAAIGPFLGAERIPNENVEQFIQEKTAQLANDHGIPEDQIVSRVVKLKSSKAVDVLFFQRDENYAAKVLGHEIGHAFDWLPQKTFSRGNILGRIASLHRYLKTLLPYEPGGPDVLTTEDRRRIRKEAEKLAKKGGTRIIEEEIEREVGITPEDILAIWNNVVDGTGGNPELYEFLARADTRLKLSIIKEAMKGRVSSELQQFSRIIKEKTGRTITVEGGLRREGESRQDAIKRIYRDLIMKEVNLRMLWERDTITQELKDLTQWWNPFNPEANADYTKYRYGSDELYAEALSVLFNAPQELQDRAPNFYQAFFNYLGNKPEVHALYNQIMDDIESGKNVSKTRKNILDGFKRGDKAYWDGLKERKKIGQSKIDVLGYVLGDVFWGIKRRAWKIFKTGRYDDNGNPLYAIDNAIYGGAEQELYLGEIKESVAPILKEHGLDWRYLDEYVLYQRITKGDREYLFNPEGLTPTTAGKMLTELKNEIGDEAFKALDKARRELWRVRNKIIKKIIGEKMWTPELNEFIKDNEYYARFDVLKYLEKNFSSDRGASVYKQLGTVESVTGPATSTIMKDLSFIRAANWNRAKRTTVSFLQQHFPNEIIEAEEKWTGKGFEAKQPDNPRTHSLITYMRDGQPVSFHIPKWAASGFDYHNAMLEDGAMRAAHTFARYLGTPFRLGFTALRPGFWLFNVLRDYQRAVKNLEGANLHNFLKYYTKALKPSFQSTFGVPDAVVKEMLKGNMLISIAQIDEHTQEDAQLERMMAMYSGQPKKFRNNIAKPFMHLFHAFLRVGQALERIPKVASKLYLDDKFPAMKPERKAHIIREQVGSPNFLNKGALTPFTNNIFLFSNAILQSWRADIDVMRERPQEAIYKTVKYAILPKMIMSTLALGGIGALLRYWGYNEDDEEEWAAGLIKWSDQTKGMYDRITDYDKTNYLPIPMGMLGNETMYLRVPQDEFQRFAGGLYWKGISGAVHGDLSAPSQALDFTSGQFPGLNPLIDITVSTLTYLSGHNPYDSFRQRDVIPEQVFQAGGRESHETFLKWLWNEAGGSFVYRFDTNDLNLQKNDWEKLMDVPFTNDIVGRFIKTTDYGLVEQQRKLIKEPLVRERARENERSEAIIRKAINEGEGNLSPKERQLLGSDDPYISRKKERETRLARHGTYERLMSNASTVEERYRTQLWILEQEGDDFDLFSLPSVRDDVGRKADILRRAVPVRRDERDEWRDDIEEALGWLNDRHITAKQVKEVAQEKINKLRSSRGDNWQRLNRQLSKITQE